MMMTMKKMKMMMMRRERLREDDEETLLELPSSPDLRTSSPSMTTTTWPLMTPPTTMLPRRSLIGRIADVVSGLARSVTGAVVRSPGIVPANNTDRTYRMSDNAAEDEDD